MINEQQYRLVKIIIAIILLVILFLFALNGRYSVIDDECMVDKWTRNNWANNVIQLIFIN